MTAIEAQALARIEAAELLDAILDLPPKKRVAMLLALNGWQPRDIAKD